MTDATIPFPHLDEALIIFGDETKESMNGILRIFEKGIRKTKMVSRENYIKHGNYYAKGIQELVHVDVPGNTVSRSFADFMAKHPYPLYRWYDKGFVFKKRDDGRMYERWKDAMENAENNGKAVMNTTTDKFVYFPGMYEFSLYRSYQGRHFIAGAYVRNKRKIPEMIASLIDSARTSRDFDKLMWIYVNQGKDAEERFKRSLLLIDRPNNTRETTDKVIESYLKHEKKLLNKEKKFKKVALHML